LNRYTPADGRPDALIVPIDLSPPTGASLGGRVAPASDVPTPEAHHPGYAVVLARANGDGIMPFVVYVGEKALDREREIFSHVAPLVYGLSGVEPLVEGWKLVNQTSAIWKVVSSPSCLPRLFKGLWGGNEGGDESECPVGYLS